MSSSIGGADGGLLSARIRALIVATVSDASENDRHSPKFVGKDEFRSRD